MDNRTFIETLSNAIGTGVSVFLAVLPFLTLGGFLVANYFFATKRESGWFPSRTMLAYLGGFLIFIIGFALFRTMQDPHRMSWLISLFVVLCGALLGGLCLWLAHKANEHNSVNWFIFLTNGFMSLAVLVYIFVQDLQDFVIYGILGIVLGLVIYGFAAPSSKKKFSNYRP